jgi:hypothetical protein
MNQWGLSLSLSSVVFKKSSFGEPNLSSSKNPREEPRVVVVSFRGRAIGGAQ